MADVGNRLTFEALTAGSNITSGDLPSGWSVIGTGGTLTCVSKTWSHGTKAARINNATAQRAMLMSTTGTAQGCQTIYFTLNTVGSAAIILSGGTGSANWRINVNRTVQARNNTTAVGTASGVIITADGTTEYRAEHSTNPGAGTQQLKVFAGDDNTSPLYDSGSQTLVGTSRTNVSFGATAAAAGMVVDILAAWYADTAWTGPIASSSGTGSASGTYTYVGAAVGDAPVTALFDYDLGSQPWYPSHRGAIGPEETQGTYDRSLVLAPTSGLECDVQEASDGYVLSHDATTTRTAATGSPFPSSNISSLTVAQYKTVQTKDLSGRGFAAESAMGLDDWFNRYGPMDCWLIPELKTGSDASAFGDYVIATGYANKTIVQAFSRPSAETLATKGLEVAHLIASGGDTTWSAIKAAGINHVVRNTSLWTTGDITAAKAAGLTAGVFTIETTIDRDAEVARGINGFIFTDYPDLLNPAPAPGQGSGTGAFTWAGTATGKRTPKASASGTANWTGAAVGKRSPKATATGTATWTGAAAGKRTPKATATGTATWTGSAVGAWPHGAGTASGTANWSGVAVGKRTPKATASGTANWTGTATGKRVAGGLAAGTYAYTGTSTGIRHPKASATGTFTWTGNAVGHAPTVGLSEGSALGSFTWHGDATGARASRGTATGAFAWTGTAAGVAPVVPGASGSASGSYAYVGAASGVAPALDAAEGSATGGYAFAGAAVGAVVRRGAAVGSYAWTGLAVGAAPNAADGHPVENPTAAITTPTPTAAITIGTRRGSITTPTPQGALVG